MTVSVLALLASSGHAFAQCSSAAAECAAKTAKASCEVSGQAMVVAEEAEAADKDIIDTAVAAGSFKTLAAALKAAGLVEALKGKGPFTVFAPTDEAFAKLPKGTVETLLKPENKAALTRILTYHVVAANVPSKDVKTGAAETLSGQRIDLKVQTKDGKTTVKVDNATVTAADVTASNGVIHVIDTVILPSDKTIVQTAAADSNFKTLASLITTAGLADALSGEGPFTVFAPTDAAFAKLPKETVESLLKPENKSKLQDILKFHVVPSRVFSDAALKAGKAKTLQGQEITIKIENGKPMVNGAAITATDIDASNGVIHVIDTVILPK
ncbi:MAG: fasciclin domain-containing protein [Phycisphaeraceae bacterium]|nr:MAG: fasciclin domain-containing protein [Phycisphaeraceae bacterium]